MSSWGSDDDTSRAEGRGTTGAASASFDTLPTSDSLRWGPDRPELGEPTASVPAIDPAPPPSPAYSGRRRPPAHRAAGRRPADGGRRPSRKETVVIGVVGVLVVIAGVAAIVTIPDGGDSADADESTASSTPLVPGDGTDPAGPIVGPTGVIGSWSGSAWLPRPDGEQPGAGLEYTVLGIGDASDTAPGDAVGEDCPAQRATSEVDVGVDLEGGSDGGPPPIAVAGVAEPRPRAVEQFDTGSPTYQQAAVEVAAGLGATTPPSLTQVLRTDLDGNGTDEVVVAAEHISDAEGLSPSAGDWSVVFLRRVAGDGATADVLASSVVAAGAGGLDRIQVATLADLNGDGTMEVALTGRSSTGQWTSIHELDESGAPSEVLRAGCED